jgi:hypothetical protein
LIGVDPQPDIGALGAYCAHALGVDRLAGQLQFDGLGLRGPQRLPWRKRHWHTTRPESDA